MMCFKGLLLAGFALCLQSASAALVLNIDTSNKTFSISGSDSGTILPLSWNGADTLYFNLSWSLTSATSLELGGGDVFFNDPAAYSSPEPILETYAALFSYVYSSGLEILMAFDFSVFNTVPDAMNITIIGTGVSYSYAGLDSVGISVLENSIGQSMQFSGTEFQPVQIVAIPEPSTWTLIFLGGLAIISKFRRRLVTGA